MSSLKSVRGRQPVIGPARLRSGTLPPAASYEGAWGYNNDRMAYSNGSVWSDLVANIDTLRTVTVGAGGDFASIGAALAYFAGFSPTAAQYVFLGKIIILNAHTVSEQVQMISQELGWVTIESQVLTTASVSRTSNVSTVTFTTPHGLAIGRTFGLSGCTDNSFDILTGTVTGVPSTTSITYAQTASDLGSTADTTGTCHVDINVDRSAFLVDDLFINGLRAFLSFANGTAPIIRCRFKATGTAPTDPGTGSPYLTVGLALRTCFFSTLDDTPSPSNPPQTTYVFRAALDGFSENIRVGANSSARIVTMELKNGGSNLVSASGTATLIRVRLRGGTSHNVLAQAGSRVSIGNSDFQRTQGSNSATDFSITQGSIGTVFGGGVTSLGGVSETEIVPTGNGILFDERVGLIPTWAGFIKPESYTVSTLPSVSTYAGSMIYVSNETGGATIAFSDGTNWRRVQDRNIVS
jgi:hypothetical protein